MIDSQRWSLELSLATSEEIQTDTGKQEVTNYKRNGQEIKMHTNILTFNREAIPREIKIWFYVENVGPYISSLFSYFKCQKYGHPKEI